MKSHSLTSSVLKPLLVLVLVLVAFTATHAFGAPREVALYTAGFKNVIESHRKVAASGAKRLEEIDPVSMRASIPNEGRLNLNFTTRRNKNWVSYFTGPKGREIDSTNPILLRGKIFLGNSRSPVSQGDLPIVGSLIPHGNYLNLKITFEGRRRAGTSGQRIYTVRTRVNPKTGKVSKAHVSSIPRRVAQIRACGSEAVHDLQISKNTVLESGDVSAMADRLAQISTDADPQWYSTYGSSSNSEIAATLDAIEVIYKRDFGIQFDIVQQNVFQSSSPYTGTDSSSVLSQFRTYTNTNRHLGTADLYHLFTGRTFDSYVAGIAYVGVVCASPSYSYGTSENLGRALNIVVAAHELGHNFGAQHDTGGGYIMSPSASSGLSQFSTQSKTQVAAHVGTYNSCLGTVSSTPTPTPTATPTPGVTPAPSGTATPTPTPETPPAPIPTPEAPDPSRLEGARLRIRADRGRGYYKLTTTLKSSAREPLKGVSVVIFRGSKMAYFRDSNSRGEVSVNIRKAGTYQAYAFDSQVSIASGRVKLR